jgi:hypothetical protein
MKKTAIFVVAAVCRACCLACPVAALVLLRYQPAVVAAPGHEMRWLTRPALWTSVVKNYQRFVEVRPCEYTVLGWSDEGVLFYEEACQDDLPQVWACDLENGNRPQHVETVPLDLVQEAASRSSILHMVRSPGVRPADAEPMVRNLEVRGDVLASPMIAGWPWSCATSTARRTSSF